MVGERKRANLTYPWLCASLISLVGLVADEIVVGYDENEDGSAHEVRTERQSCILDHFLFLFVKKGQKRVSTCSIPN